LRNGAALANLAGGAGEGPPEGPLRMIALIDLLILAVLAFVGFQAYRGWRGGGARRSGGPIIDGRAERKAESPARSAAEHLRELSNAQADLKARYPLLFGMLGGYLNGHSIAEAGGLETAVARMIADWSPRREEVKAELVRVLAENPDEADVRAIVISSCEATFEAEGYRDWLIWLLSRFGSA
jgi:hypothetical protein